MIERLKLKHGIIFIFMYLSFCFLKRYSANKHCCLFYFNSICIEQINRTSFASEWNCTRVFTFLASIFLKIHAPVLAGLGCLFNRKFGAPDRVSIASNPSMSLQIGVLIRNLGRYRVSERFALTDYVQFPNYILTSVQRVDLNFGGFHEVFLHFCLFNGNIFRRTRYCYFIHHNS